MNRLKTGFCSLLVGVGFWSAGVQGAALEDSNPFDTLPLQEETSSLEVDANPFNVVSRTTYDGRFIGKTIVLVLKDTGTLFTGELQRNGNTFPVEAKFGIGCLEGTAGKVNNSFKFKLEKKEGGMLFTSEGTREELTRKEFPTMESEYYGDKGLHIQVKKTGELSYSGELEFAQQKMNYTARISGGDWDGVFKIGEKNYSFVIAEEAGDLVFKSGGFISKLEPVSVRNLRLEKDELLKTAQKAKAAGKWSEVLAQAESILKIDPTHSEATQLKKEALLARVREAKESQNWTEVQTTTSEILKLEPNNPEAIQLKKEVFEKLVLGKPYKVSLKEGVEIEMVYIQPGTFTMGSPKNERGRRDDETPHTVTLTKGYWLGKYEMTQAQYQTVMGENPSKFKGESLPVGNIKWNDATEFCKKLTAQERAAGRLPQGYEYTLPTEAQWEYACRAGTRTALHSGKNLTSEEESCPNLDEVGWYGENSEKKTHPVGQKQPNAWGLYDMHGNVEEWCKDLCNDEEENDMLVTDTYVNEVQDPLCTRGAERVLRGGGCWNNACECRAGVRYSAGPTNYNSAFGFRLSLVPSAP